MVLAGVAVRKIARHRAVDKRIDRLKASRESSGCFWRGVAVTTYCVKELLIQSFRHAEKEANGLGGGQL